MSLLRAYGEWLARSSRTRPLVLAVTVPLLVLVARLFGPAPIDHAQRDLWAADEQRLVLRVDVRGGDHPAARWQLRHATGGDDSRALYTSMWEPSPTDRAADFCAAARGTSLATGHLVASVGSWLCVAPPGARAVCIRDATRPVGDDAALTAAWDAARAWASQQPSVGAP